MSPTPPKSGQKPAGSADALALVSFWAGSSAFWFAKNAEFDRVFKDRFFPLYSQVAARKHDDWIASTDEALALVILTDQFPRNAFRGTARMYETDALARHYASKALGAGYMKQVEPDLRLFLCLPFAHSENRLDQNLSVKLNASLGEPWLSHAKGHREITRCFGRFPHRNQILGRVSTPAEQAYLGGGGFQG